MPYAPNPISVASRAIMVWSLKRKSIKMSLQSQSLTSKAGLAIIPVFFFPLHPRLLASIWKKKNFKDDTTSLLVACSCTSRCLSCVHKDGQLTGTRGNPDIVGFDSFSFSKILYRFVLEEGLLVGAELNGIQLWTLQELFNWVVWEEVFTQDRFVRLKFSKKLNLYL